MLPMSPVAQQEVVRIDSARIDIACEFIFCSPAIKD
jgi:hypothetical protein